MEKKEEKTIREKLLDREQNLIRAQEDSKFFACETEPIHNVDVHITIPAKGANLEKIFQAERLLTEAGLSFDTGYGSGCRDWEFDWSLHGAFVKKVRDLSEKEQITYKIDRLLKPGKDAPHLPCKVLAGLHNDFFVIVFGRKKDFESVIKKRFLENGAKEIYSHVLEATTEQQEQTPVGFGWREHFIKVSYTENETGY